MFRQQARCIAIAPAYISALSPYEDAWQIVPMKKDAFTLFTGSAVAVYDDSFSASEIRAGNL